MSKAGKGKVGVGKKEKKEKKEKKRGDTVKGLEAILKAGKDGKGYTLHSHMMNMFKSFIMGDSTKALDQFESLSFEIKNKVTNDGVYNYDKELFLEYKNLSQNLAPFIEKAKAEFFPEVRMFMDINLISLSQRKGKQTKEEKNHLKLHPLWDIFLICLLKAGCLNGLELDLEKKLLIFS